MKTYKNLKKVMAENFVFSKNEIDSAFDAYVNRKDIYSSEAVNAFGGFKTLISATRHSHKVNLRKRLEAKKACRIEIEQDIDILESPRDWSNLGTMVCFYRSYELGDKHDLSIEEAQELYDSKNVVALPLFLMDHSGLSISTSDFGCPWDSGQVGFIYATYEDIKKTFMVDTITDDILEKAKQSLKSEVKVYDQYLCGDVYGFVIRDGRGEILESCWGFYGYETCEEEAKTTLDSIGGKTA